MGILYKWEIMYESLLGKMDQKESVSMGLKLKLQGYILELMTLFKL